jgi:hypothetical protein
VPRVALKPHDRFGDAGLVRLAIAAGREPRLLLVRKRQCRELPRAIVKVLLVRDRRGEENTSRRTGSPVDRRYMRASDR